MVFRLSLPEKKMFTLGTKFMILVISIKYNVDSYLDKGVKKDFPKQKRYLDFFTVFFGIVSSSDSWI